MFSPMAALDGFYRHLGATMTWDDSGVTFRATGREASRVGWDVVEGARQIGKRPGFVQLLVSGHVPPADPALDPFSIRVASNADANRLVTSVGWRTTNREPGRRLWWRSRRRQTS
jgi:hypothetical protein